MTVGGVFSEAWEYYTKFFRRFVMTSAAVFVVLNLLAAIAADARGKNATLALAWGLVSSIASLVGTFWVQGALVVAIDDVRDGRVDLSIEQLYRRTRPFLGALLVAGLIAAVVGAIGLLLLVAPGLFVLTRWAVFVPVIVLERRRGMESLRRSSRLVSGHGWTVFGIVFLTLLLNAVATLALVSVFSFLPTFAAVWIGGLVAQSLVTPFVALAWTVTYFELHRRETPLAAAA